MALNVLWSVGFFRLYIAYTFNITALPIINCAHKLGWFRFQNFWPDLSPSGLTTVRPHAKSVKMVSNFGGYIWVSKCRWQPSQTLGSMGLPMVASNRTKWKWVPSDFCWILQPIGNNIKFSLRLPFTDGLDYYYYYYVSLSIWYMSQRFSSSHIQNTYTRTEWRRS